MEFPLQVMDFSIIFHLRTDIALIAISVFRVKFKVEFPRQVIDFPIKLRLLLTVNSDIDCSCCSCTHSITGCTLIPDHVIRCSRSAHIHNGEWWCIRKYIWTAKLSPRYAGLRFTRCITCQCDVGTFNRCLSHFVDYDRWRIYKENQKSKGTKM